MTELVEWTKKNKEKGSVKKPVVGSKKKKRSRAETRVSTNETEGKQKQSLDESKGTSVAEQTAKTQEGTGHKLRKTNSGGRANTAGPSPAKKAVVQEDTGNTLRKTSSGGKANISGPSPTKTTATSAPAQKSAVMYAAPDTKTIVYSDEDDNEQTAESDQDPADPTEIPMEDPADAQRREEEEKLRIERLQIATFTANMFQIDQNTGLKHNKPRRSMLSPISRSIAVLIDATILHIYDILSTDSDTVQKYTVETIRPLWCIHTCTHDHILKIQSFTHARHQSTISACNQCLRNQ